MKTTFFVVNVGFQKYAKHTLPFIHNYCKKYNYNLFVLEDNVNNRPPAWYKLLASKFCDADLIVSCDLDIIPMPKAPPIHLNIYPNKINMCEDMIIGKRNKRYNEKFVYNSGLIAAPRDVSNFLLNVYEKHSHKNRLCWEQLFLNDEIFDHNIDVNKLDERWNYMIRFDDNQNPKNLDDYFKHLTCGNTRSNRDLWAKDHFEFYKNSFLSI